MLEVCVVGLLVHLLTDPPARVDDVGGRYVHRPACHDNLLLPAEAMDLDVPDMARSPVEFPVRNFSARLAAPARASGQPE
jgi:hypothetical protein